MKLSMKYGGTYLLPSDAASVEAYETLKRGEYIVEIKEERNPRFHRLAFALIKAMFDNQERFTNFEDFRRELKIMTGSYEDYIRHNGDVVLIPKSWSFAVMDDIEFHEIYNKLLTIAERRYGSAFVNQFETI